MMAIHADTAPRELENTRGSGARLKTQSPGSITARSSKPEVHEEMSGGANTQPQKLMLWMLAKGAASPKKRVQNLGMIRSMKRHCWLVKSVSDMNTTTRQKLGSEKRLVELSPPPPPPPPRSAASAVVLSASAAAWHHTFTWLTVQPTCPQVAWAAQKGAKPTPRPSMALAVSCGLALAASRAGKRSRGRRGKEEGKEGDGAVAHGTSPWRGLWRKRERDGLRTWWKCLRRSGLEVIIIAFARTLP
mmetsp:Transcript_27487/g.55308  ORF Transcript_27487/g.55308 Transcript_27487/m.55308 type:complete len:246 (-) Transcript_27487:265-1002(-)